MRAKMRHEVVGLGGHRVVDGAPGRVVGVDLSSGEPISDVRPVADIDPDEPLVVVLPRCRQGCPPRPAGR
jgi:hypothetical protein